MKLLPIAGLVTALAVVPFTLETSSAGAKADPQIVVVLKGDGTPLANPPIPGAICYETTLYDAKTNRAIGTGIDCLADITPVDNGFLVNRTTIFEFPQGTIWANGPTTVVPTTGGSPGYTHVVGDVPTDGTNSIVQGTGAFQGASGSVRLSGAVNMGGFPDQVGFDCIFVIDLD